MTSPGRAGERQALRLAVSSRPSGVSLGRAGGSLDDASFAANVHTAKAGQVGEQLTAKLLDAQAASGGFTVLHDLRIPHSKANVDHVVVAGRRVWVLDSKLWKAGFYITIAGRTYRRTRDGFDRAEHADKRGLPLGHTRLSEHLTGLGAKMQRPLMVIHPSRRGERVRMWAYRPASDAGAKVRAVHPAQLRFPARTADERIVAALARLMN